MGLNSIREDLEFIIESATSRDFFDDIGIGYYKNLYEDLRTDLSTVHPYSVLLAMNAKLAQAASLDRLRVKSSRSETPANYYSLLFMPSGGGKDYPIKYIDSEFMGPFDTRFKATAAHYFEERNKQVSEEAEEKNSAAGKDQYTVQHGARFLVPSIKNATPEGFYDYRLELQRAAFGGSFVQISEFADYITAGDSSGKGSLLSDILDVWDDGNSLSKAIKGDKIQISVEGVPNSALLHTSLAGLEGRNKSKLMTFLDRGGARRFFVGYIPEPFGLVSSLEEAVKLSRGHRSDYSIHRRTLNAMLNAVSRNSTICLDAEAEAALDVYGGINMMRVSRMNPRTQGGLIANIRSLERKVFKLAGVIAAFTHPEVWEVNIADIYTAMVQAELGHLHIGKFYEGESNDVFVKVLNYLKKQKEHVSLTEIRTETNLKRFEYDELRSSLDDFHDYARLQGFYIEIEPHGTNGKKLKLSNL